MKEPTLREVFRVSWKLSIRHKGLWVLGLFAIVLGQLGILDVLSGVVKGASGSATSEITNKLFYLFSADTFESIGKTLNYSFDSWAALAWLLVILLVLGFGILITASISQGGIVHATALSIEHGLKSIEKFDESWHAGARNASHILLLNIVKKSILFALSLCVALAAYASLIYGTTASIFTFILVFIIAIILGMTVSMLTMFAVAYLVVEKDSLFEAVRRAWILLLKHWVVSFEVGIVLVMLNFVVFALLLVGVYVFVTPSLAINAYGALIGSTAISQFGTSMAIVLFLGYAAVLGSIFTVFVTSTWTYLFAIMHHWGFKSRVHAFFTGLKRP